MKFVRSTLCFVLSFIACVEKGVIGSIHYDKDSIAYPFQTKGFFGAKLDKSIVSVWTRYTFAQQGIEIRNLSYVYCEKRQIVLKSIIIDGQYAYDSPLLNRLFGIEPNTTDEKLYNILCA